MSGNTIGFRFNEALACMALLASITACEEEFASRTQLEGYRVVGVEAAPPEATPDDTVLLSAHDFYAGPEAVSYDWSVCVYGLGGETDFECEDPDLQFPLGTGSSVMLDMSPEGLGFRALLEELGSVPGPNGDPLSLDRGLDAWVRLESGPDCADCARIATVKRLRLRDNPGAPNQNPVISAFEVVGEVAPGARVSLEVTTEPPETFLDVASNQSVEEEFLYTWYTSAGETDPPLTFGTTRETELLLPNELGDITLMVAVRDGRGGLAVETLVLSP